MDKKEILAFITANPTCFIATTDGQKPHVRAFGTFRADENGILFNTQSAKDVYKQLANHPDVEICYFANRYHIRVIGTVQWLEDMTLKKEFVAKRPFLKSQVEEHGWDFLKVFTLKNARATVDDMRQGPPVPGAPKTWIDL
jgi:pyridoxamine 5'-phosphate oxidase